MSEANWLTEFPQMDRKDLLFIRKGLDGAYKEFSRAYGEIIENLFDPLLRFLVWFEKLLVNSPWWIIIAVLCSIVYSATRSVKLTIGVLIAFLLIGYFGMWENTMRTMSIIFV